MAETQTKTSVWNSLEVMKIIASLLTPIVVVVMGGLIQNQIARLRLGMEGANPPRG